MRTHHRARLTWPEVLSIRNLFSHPHPPPIRAVARTYRVDPHTIRDILAQKTWTQVPEHQVPDVTTPEGDTP